jgi:hypothetical protein
MYICKAKTLAGFELMISNIKGGAMPLRHAASRANTNQNCEKCTKIYNMTIKYTK